MFFNHLHEYKSNLLFLLKNQALVIFNVYIYIYFVVNSFIFEVSSGHTHIHNCPLYMYRWKCKSSFQDNIWGTSSTDQISIRLISNHLLCFLAHLHVCQLLYYDSFLVTLIFTLSLASTHISSSSCRAGSTDIHDNLSPTFPIIYRPREFFLAQPASLHSWSM